jgi:hypothetical protein
MTRRSPNGSAFTWIAMAIAAAVVLAVIVVIAALWSGLGDAQISLVGWLAMGFGIVVTLALGIGLMSLVFISSRYGYDEAARKDC